MPEEEIILLDEELNEVYKYKVASSSTNKASYEAIEKVISSARRNGNGMAEIKRDTLWAFMGFEILNNKTIFPRPQAFNKTKYMEYSKTANGKCKEYKLFKLV